MDFALRPLRESDRTSWQQLYRAYLHFYETEPVLEATELVWKRLSSLTPEIHSVVAEFDGQLAGIAHFHFQVSTWEQSSVCYLEDLYVDERFRGRGLATALIREVQRTATEQGCEELYWITRASNSTARSVYEKLAEESDFIRYEMRLGDSL